MKAEGFAVLFGGAIAVKTVSETPFGAKVNGLVTLFRMMVLQTNTEDQINAAWAAFERRHDDLSIVPVTITAQEAS